MKRLMLFVFVLAVLIMPCSLLAQQTNVTSTVTTTESAGTISEFSPDTIVIRSETSSSPNRYNYTEKTTYVDESGAVVSRETVKSGAPVTVHFTRDGDRMIANKVVVRKTTTTGKSGIEEKTSTRTTTETKY